MSEARNEVVKLAVANLLAELAEEHEIHTAAGKLNLLRQIEAAAAELRRGM